VAEEHIPVSVYMITFNNARTVEKALRSVAWADEIVVVDSFSTDGTLEIIQALATRVIQRPWPGFRDQYQFAADACTREWAVFIDADEAISPELAAEIRDELQRNCKRPEAEQVQGYYGHRRTWYLDRWIMHGGWVPDYEIRLYRRAAGQWLGDLHAKIHINGRVAHLRHFYHHDTYADITDQIRKINDYSSTAAGDMDRAVKRFSLFHMCGNAVCRFCRDYLLKSGWRDGMPGFILAINTMFYVFAKHAKLWERQHQVNKETKT